MILRQLVLEQNYDLPRSIVWGALIDPVLVGGWLGEARIDARCGGKYDLDWLGATAFPSTTGTITAIVDGERLTVATAVHGTFDIVLDPRTGGARGSSTRLRLTVTLELENAFAPRVRANWATSLDQLAALLRGHPVDWGEERASMGQNWTLPLSPGTLPGRHAQRPEV